MNQLKIALDQIIRNETQPRTIFDEASIAELAESIKKDGLQSPIMVRPLNSKYEIVQGERRYRAAQVAGLSEIDAFVKELTDEDAFHLAVIENIQREQLSPIEEANAFKRYVEMGYTHEEIAKKVSKSRTYVTSRLRLLKLIPEIQDMIAEGKISEGHAKVLLSAKNDICEVLDVCIAIHKTNDPFEYIQNRFILEFKDSPKISVNDVRSFLTDFIDVVVFYELYMLQSLAWSERTEKHITDSFVKIERDRKSAAYSQNAQFKEAVERWALAEKELYVHVERSRSVGINLMGDCLSLGISFELLTPEIIQGYFDRAVDRREGEIKAWQILKAADEWIELLKEVKDKGLEFDKIIDILKERDLREEFKVIF